MIQIDCCDPTRDESGLVQILSCSQIFRRTNYAILDFPCNWISCKWNSIKLSLEESEHIFPQDYSLMLKGDSAFLCISSLTKHFL